jgi:hypothetical protein
MLHFSPRLIGHAVTAHWPVAAQSQIAQHPCQRRVADLGLLFLDQLLVDSLYPPVALMVETLQQFGVNLNPIVPLFSNDLPLLPDDRPHRIATDV